MKKFISKKAFKTSLQLWDEFKGTLNFINYKFQVSSHVNKIEFLQTNMHEFAI